MSPRRTRRGTIRESVIETSIDSSLKNTSKITKRSRRANKSLAKTSEDESDSPVEVQSPMHSTASASVLDDTSSKAKKRKRGGPEASQDSSLSVTIEQPTTKSRSNRNNAKTPRTAKQTTSSRSRTVDSQAVSSGEETSNVKTDKRVSYNLMSDSEDSSGLSSKKKAKSARKGGKTPEQSPERVPSKSVPADKNVTPKTSPALNVSFTPHRSKKTPRKSPVNLGSPKTHSPNPAKFLIVPRKLSIVDSPPTSEDSLLQNSANKSTKNTSKSGKSSKAKLNVSSSKRKTITPFKPRPTFSKSPKIVLKTPKAKSSKKATPKGSAATAKSKKPSPSKQKKTPVKSGEKPKSRKSTKNESLSVSQDTSALIDFNETVTRSPQKSPNKSANTSVKSPVKSPRASSSAKSKLELLSSSLKSIPKVVLSSLSAKTPTKSPKPASPTKAKSSPKKASPVKSAASPKIKLASISKGTPKIVLVRKSPVKSAKQASPTKSRVSSPSKTRTSPSKSKTNTSQESSASPVKTKTSTDSKSTSQESSVIASPVKTKTSSSSKSKSPSKSASPKKSSPSKSKKSPVKSTRSSLNTSAKKTPNTSLSTGSSPKKMPKIVLSSKSKKSPLKSSKSATPSSTQKSTKPAPAPKTPKVLVKSPRSTPVSKALKVPVKQQSRKSSPTKNRSKNATLSPKVVVSKLSSPDLRNNSLRAKENQPKVTLVSLDHASSKTRSSLGRSPKSPKSAANRKSSSPIKSPKSVAKRSSGAGASSKIATPSGALANKFLNLKPKNTSTPREKGKPARSPLGKSKIIKRLNNQSTIQGEQFLADESAPFLDNSSLIRMSDVFDVDTPRKNNTFDKNSSKTKSPRVSGKLNKSDTFEVDQSPKNTSRRSNRSGTFEVTKTSPSASFKNKSKKNNTYELNEPKTPGLQSKSIKRTVTQAGLDGEPSSKKSRKVNFASPARENARASSINRIGTPAHPKNQRKTPISISKAKTPLKSVESRSRISAVGLKTPVSTPLNKRRSVSVADTTKSRRSNYDAQVASVNRLSRPKLVTDSQKKLETKTPVQRKIPNFAEIHQKNFAKMESLVDLKKRVEKRHGVMNAGSAKKAASDSTNGAYTRFGFKVRKNEAVDLIKKKAASADSREKKRENARTALKGVRMNRRFELQMKARIKTS